MTIVSIIYESGMNLQPKREMENIIIPPFGKGRAGGIFVVRTSSKNLPSPLFAKEGYFLETY
jgi:hypothetical protein